MDSCLDGLDLPGMSEVRDRGGVARSRRAARDDAAGKVPRWYVTLTGCIGAVYVSARMCA
jgi:hypothetical protein